MKRLIIMFVLLPFIMGMRSCDGFPSSFFQGLDQNSDSQLSYREWMIYYSLPEHDHSIEHCSRKDFYSADCDQDDLLTWGEYSDFRFKRLRCTSPAVPTLNQKYEADVDLKGNISKQGFKVFMSRWYKELNEREVQLKRRYRL